MQFALAEGVDAIEDRLDEMQIDATDLHRESVV